MLHDAIIRLCQGCVKWFMLVVACACDYACARLCDVMTRTLPLRGRDESGMFYSRLAFAFEGGCHAQEV